LPYHCEHQERGGSEDIGGGGEDIGGGGEDIGEVTVKTSVR